MIARAAYLAVFDCPYSYQMDWKVSPEYGDGLLCRKSILGLDEQDTLIAMPIVPLNERSLMR